jgi:hypothetical protein
MALVAGLYVRVGMTMVAMSRLKEIRDICHEPSSGEGKYDD